MALSNASFVNISLGFGPCDMAISTARRPVASAAWARRASTAGIDAVPGKHMPSASTSDVMVEAVPISLQCPAEGLAADSSSSKSASVIFPARSSSAYFHVSVPTPSCLPRKCAGSWGPTGEHDGRDVRTRSTHELGWNGLVAAAQEHDGVQRVARMDSSTSMAMRFRNCMAEAS